MFEQEYSRANDRIHPRKDLLQELEKKWAAEEEREQQEQDKVRSFPGWVKFVAAAAGIVLCVGIGMGSMVLFSRGRGFERSASVPSVMADEYTEPEAAILLEPEADMAVEADMGSAPDGAAVANGKIAEYKAAGMQAASGLPSATAAATLPPPVGMHPAMDEAEVENTLRVVDPDREAATANTVLTAETACPAGKLIVRDDLLMVYQPTAEQVHVVRYANNKLSRVFSLALGEQHAQVKALYWMDDELLAVREKEGETELLRFDVADWKTPHHSRSLVQSGAFLAAEEVGGRLYVLSGYSASEQEPLPWVDGDRMDLADVLLDRDQPGDTFTVLTVYDPSQDGFTCRQALLASVAGAAFGHDKVLLWTEADQHHLYVLSWSEDALALSAERTVSGELLSAEAIGEGFVLLLQQGEEAEMLTMDGALTETGSMAAQGAGPVRWYGIYEDGVVFLTANAIHYLSEVGDRTLALKGDAFEWLTPDRGLVLSADGQLQAVAVDGSGITALGCAQVKEGLSLLLQDPSRLAFDMGTGRLLIPAGQKVYSFILDDQGNLAAYGTPLIFYDHKENDQLELRCYLTENRDLVFYKTGVALYNERLARQLACKY